MKGKHDGDEALLAMLPQNLNDDIPVRTLVIASTISRKTSLGTGLLKSTPDTSAPTVGPTGVTLIC